MKAKKVYLRWRDMHWVSVALFDHYGARNRRDVAIREGRLRKVPGKTGLYEVLMPRRRRRSCA